MITQSDVSIFSQIFENVQKVNIQSSPNILIIKTFLIVIST